MCRFRFPPRKPPATLPDDAELDWHALDSQAALQQSGAICVYDRIMTQQPPATTGGTAATAHGLLPLTASATFAPFQPTPSLSPSTSLSPSPAVLSAESVGSCTSEEQPAPGSQPDTAGTATTREAGTPAAQLLHRLPSRELQHSAARQAPEPCRLVVISVRTLAALAAAANRQLVAPLHVPVEGSGDNFADDSSEVDSGSMQGTHNMHGTHSTHSAKRQRIGSDLQAAAVYRQVSAAAARMAAAAAAEQRQMGPAVAQAPPAAFVAAAAGPYCVLPGGAFCPLLPPFQLPLLPYGQPPQLVPPAGCPPLHAGSLDPPLAHQEPPVPCPSISGWGALVGCD